MIFDLFAAAALLFWVAIGHLLSVSVLPAAVSAPRFVCIAAGNWIGIIAPKQNPNNGKSGRIYYSS
jgi:hypothetical protein